MDARVRHLWASGCEQIYRETASGTKTDRAQFRRALDQLAGGDVLMYTAPVRFSFPPQPL